MTPDMEMSRPDYEFTPATLRISRRIIAHYPNAKTAIAAYLSDPSLFDGPDDVAVWIGRRWHCTYHADRKATR